MSTYSYTKNCLLALLAFGSVFLSATKPVAQAQDAGALLNILVKKGVLSDQEAEDVRAELQKESAATPAGKLNLAPALTELKLSGDVRARYEYRSGVNGNGNPDDSMERDRFRYRLRLALTGRLAGGWFFGMRLETGSSNRSTNVTEGDYVLQPFGKNTGNTLYVGQAYVGYTNSDFTFTAGRFANPFITTAMVWDDDINVEGISEQWTHTNGNITLFANIAQLVYAGVGTHNTFGNAPGISNTYLFGNQVGARMKLPNSMYFQIAPTYYFYSNNGAGLGVLTGPNVATLRPTGLEIIDVPFELGLPALADGAIPVKIFGDVAYNFDSKDRAEASSVPSYKNENLAWQAGVSFGQTKEPGNWELRGFYQSVDAFALDSNLVDSDLFDSRTNMKGWGVSATYVISPGVSAKITYANADRKNDGLPTYGAGDIATLNLNHYQLLQTDLNIKF